MLPSPCPSHSLPVGIGVHNLRDASRASILSRTDDNRLLSNFPRHFTGGFFFFLFPSLSACVRRDCSERKRCGFCKPRDRAKALKRGADHQRTAVALETHGGRGVSRVAGRGPPGSLRWPDNQGRRADAAIMGLVVKSRGGPPGSFQAPRCSDVHVIAWRRRDSRVGRGGEVGRCLGCCRRIGLG